MIYFERVKEIGKIYNIDVEYISDEILNLDEKKKCLYKDYRCNQAKKKIYYDVVTKYFKREKQLKRWHRQWKINLIKEMNPKFKDLS